VGHTFPQNSQKYLECWLTSIFLICFLKLAPYLVPAHHKSISSWEKNPKVQQINVLYLRLRLHCYSSNSQKVYIHQARTNSDHENQTPRMRITIFADNSCFLRAFRLPLNQTHSECQSLKNNCILNKLKSIVGWYAMDIEALSEVEWVSEYSTTSTMSFHCHGKENLTNRS
jgi:hypothetical protein